MLAAPLVASADHLPHLPVVPGLDLPRVEVVVPCQDASHAQLWPPVMEGLVHLHEHKHFWELSATNCCPVNWNLPDPDPDPPSSSSQSCDPGWKASTSFNHAHSEAA